MQRPAESKIIAIINQKGGVGKTTSTVNIGAALANRGYRCLLIDLDPQAHLTMHFGLELNHEQKSVYELLVASQPVSEVILKINDHLSVLPSHINLAAAEVELAGVVGREVILHEALQQLPQQEFDFMLIGCPPSPGLLTVNALCAAKEVYVCLQAHFLALQGLGKLLETVHLVTRRINPHLRVTGVVVCMYESGTRLAVEVINDLKQFLQAARGTRLPWADAAVFNAVIRRNVKLAESPSYGTDIFRYAPTSHGAEDYNALTDELLARYGLIAPPSEQSSAPPRPQQESRPAPQDAQPLESAPAPIKEAAGKSEQERPDQQPIATVENSDNDQPVQSEQPDQSQIADEPPGLAGRHGPVPADLGHGDSPAQNRPLAGDPRQG